MDVRLILDAPQTGAWNMSWDEALLQSTAATGQVTFRLYRWSRPTLSLGYFQRVDDRLRHATSLPCDCVRRSTGGGAILHDDELTYSFSWPAAARGKIDHFYVLFHESLVQTLSDFGIHARRCEEPRNEQPFLCFQRRAVGDLLIGGDKVGGSAQRRRRGAALQHGSLLWQRSPHAPELPGVADITGASDTIDDFQNRWLEVLGQQSSAFQARLDGWKIPTEWVAGEWTTEEIRTAGQMYETRFTRDDWNKKR